MVARRRALESGRDHFAHGGSESTSNGRVLAGVGDDYYCGVIRSQTWRRLVEFVNSTRLPINFGIGS